MLINEILPLPTYSKGFLDSCFLGLLSIVVFKMDCSFPFLSSFSHDIKFVHGTGQTNFYTPGN